MTYRSSDTCVPTHLALIIMTVSTAFGAAAAAASDYTHITSGSCADVAERSSIVTKDGCEAAAAYLGLGAITAKIGDADDKPWGCYLMTNGNLWVNTNANNEGNGADSIRHPLCAIPGKDISPTQVDQVFDTVPSGAVLDFDNVEKKTPFTYQTASGVEHRILVQPSICTQDSLQQRVSAIPDGVDRSTGIYTMPVDAAPFVVKYSAPDGTVCDATPIEQSGLVLHLDAASDQIKVIGDAMVEEWGLLKLPAAEPSFGLVVLGQTPTLVTRESWDAGPAAYVTFDSHHDGLSSDSVPNTFPSGAEDRSVVSVVRFTTGYGSDDGATVTSIGWGSPGCGDNDWAAAGVAGADSILFDACEKTKAASHAAEPSAGGLGWFIQTTVLKAGDLTFYRDGVPVGTEAAQLPSGGTATDTMWMGKRPGSTPVVTGTVMDVAEVLVYNRALSDDELRVVHSRLYERHLLQPSEGEETLLNGGGGNHRRCVAVDDEATAVLECDAGFAISNVNFASYGVQSKPESICPAADLAGVFPMELRRTGPCHSEFSTAVVAQNCVGKSKCEIPVSPGLFGEDCLEHLPEPTRTLVADVTCSPAANAPEPDAVVIPAGISAASCDMLPGFGYSEASTEVCSTPSIGGTCFKKIKYDHAEAVCANVGARICTSKELKKGIGLATGCGFEQKATWSDNAKCPKEGQRVAVTLKKSGKNKNKCYKTKKTRALRCCADKTGYFSALASSRPAEVPRSAASCTTLVADHGFKLAKLGHVCGSSEILGTCHKYTANHDKAVSVCASVGARLCTFSELILGVGDDKGCKIKDDTWIWVDQNAGKGLDTGPPRQTPEGKAGVYKCPDPEMSLAQRPDAKRSPACTTKWAMFSVRCCADTHP